MNAKWLQEQFERAPFKTKASLAQALGLEPSAISKILRGTRQIKAFEYAKMRSFFGLAPEFDGDDGRATRIRPLLDGVEQGEYAGHVANDEVWVIPTDVLQKGTQATPEHIRIFSISEPLMEPDFKRDEHVLIDLTQTLPSPPGCFVISDGFSHMVRFCEIVAGSDPVEVRITARSNLFSTQRLKLDEFNVLGRVIAKLQWL